MVVLTRFLFEKVKAYTKQKLKTRSRIFESPYPFGVAQAFFQRSEEANLVLRSVRSIDGPINESSTLGILVPDFLKEML
jgi:hypothetical protein